MSKRDDLFDGHDRRTFLTTAGAATMTAALTGCDGAPGDRYTLAAESSRTPLPIDPDFASLVRYASLAPSGHNTQPWLFSHSERHVRIAADPKRRTPVGDPDDHHLYVSLGCATENFAIAAGARGQSCEITSRDGRVDIALGTTAVRADALFDAIPHRQMTRSAYDRRPVAPATIRQLEAAAATDGVAVHILTATRDRDAIRDLVVAGNDAQMDDPAFIAELKNWIRFDAPSAIEHRDGL